MTIRPIATDEDHTRALRQIEALWGAAPGTPEGDRLDVLATLVEHYEETRFPVRQSDPIETIRIHMEMTGRNQGDLSTLLGSASRASELLNRKRALTMDMAYRLHDQWGIPADALLTPYQLKRA
jgi:HTH-type transcriptional regulator/antitoxin HigA